MTENIYKNLAINIILNSERLKTFSKESEVAQSCPTLCDPMDCNPPGSSIHGIFQARVLELVAISFSRASSWPSNQTWVPHIASRCSTIWATREAPRKPITKAKTLESCLMVSYHCATSIKLIQPKYSVGQKNLLGIFCKMLWGNPNELFCQLSIYNFYLPVMFQ